MRERPDHTCAPRDSVDRLVADWRRSGPGLDYSPVEVVARLGRVRRHVSDALESVFAEHDLTAPSFAVLVTLVRLDAPEGVPQRRLMDELGLTSGTVSVRMDRLADRGLVERRSDAEDGRNTRIVLTARGREVFERVVPAHLENERRLLSALDDEEKAALVAILRKLLVEFEGAVPLDKPHRLGLVVAPAHVTIRMRRAVGLDPVAGLLVKRVEESSPASGKILAGDVLVRAGGHDLTSVSALYAAIAAGAATGRVGVTLLRGPDRVRIRVGIAGALAGDLPVAATRGRRGVEEHVL